MEDEFLCLKPLQLHENTPSQCIFIKIFTAIKLKNCQAFYYFHSKLELPDDTVEYRAVNSLTESSTRFRTLHCWANQILQTRNREAVQKNIFCLQKAFWSVSSSKLVLKILFVTSQSIHDERETKLQSVTVSFWKHFYVSKTQYRTSQFHKHTRFDPLI